MSRKSIDCAGSAAARPQRSGFKDYRRHEAHERAAREGVGAPPPGTATTYALHPRRRGVQHLAPCATVQWFSKLFMLSNEEGARTPLYCATAPELSSSSGRYYNIARGAHQPAGARCALARGAVDENGSYNRVVSGLPINARASSTFPKMPTAARRVPAPPSGNRRRLP